VSFSVYFFVSVCVCVCEAIMSGLWKSIESQSPPLWMFICVSLSVHVHLCLTLCACSSVSHSLCMFICVSLSVCHSLTVAACLSLCVQSTHNFKKPRVCVSLSVSVGVSVELTHVPKATIPVSFDSNAHTKYRSSHPQKH